MAGREAPGSVEPIHTRRMVVTTPQVALIFNLPTMESTPDAALPAGAERARLQGCGKDDAPLTLYRIADGTRPTGVSSNYSHIPCGYRPGVKIRRRHPAL